MKLVVLDRDGVINVWHPDGVATPDQWEPIAGSLEAIVRLNLSGYRVVVATNQSGIARGLFDLGDLHAVHRKLHNALDSLGGRVDAILYCPHRDGDECDCRKPKPGMLHDVARRLDTELVNVPVVGDALRDMQAAMAVGARPYLVRTGKGATTLAQNPALAQQIEVCNDLAEVVDQLLSNTET
ncbi:MAG: D-glycero-beta-D-manno-heptose 1,7-bisphosphate 7-phosphatase [Pseudomonadota bacterium]